MEADGMVFTGTPSKVHYQVYSGFKKTKSPTVTQNKVIFFKLK